MPDRLKHFTSVQNGRLILVMGGLNSIMENPFDLEGAEQLSDQVFSDSYIFNIKSQRFITKSQMSMPRAKHFSCIYTDPKDPTNRIAIAAGGATIEKKIDLFRKQKTEKYIDCDIVE